MGLSSVAAVCRWIAVICWAALLPAVAAGGGIEDRFFRASDGVRLHYSVQGAGETIVLVPGWTMPASIWVMVPQRPAGRVLRVQGRVMAGRLGFG